MTKSLARQRAHYKRQLALWEAGKWSPPAGWPQMVVNRFPDLIDAMRERVLGKEEADRARDLVIEQRKPKVGAIVTLADLTQRIIERVEPVVERPGKFAVITAKLTLWNLVRIRVRAFFSRLLKRKGSR